ncbi:hypothetical protein IV203_012886 [Nitzschia inconspicua]|uniref:Uncharacterized protein n=1 Tax=Nitzschia inconspicua TaxID=303405 RepID=A0A9K3M449_9STRA|nr:hypothetical protein IV203_012884 [Nitzschia inconspicua]KAG7373791.1 hypothetical protein IV203_012886 [Nitzschia inconspicua]
MGNFHSAHIGCFIEKQSGLKPGESLRGTILLDVNDPQAVQESFNGISILVAGVEYHREQHDNDENGSEDAMVSTGNVIRVKSVIDISSMELTKGQHVIPFKVALPTYQDHEAHQRSVRNDASSSVESLESRPPLMHLEASQGISSISSSSCLTMSDSELSVSPFCTNNKVFIHLENIPEATSSPTKATAHIVYNVKASLKRKDHVPLSVDTDIKCHAKCMKKMDLQKSLSAASL